MPSTERAARRRRLQSGQSLVEALVASVVLGLTIVAGLAALDVSAQAAARATHLSWGECVARAEAGVIQAAPYDPGAAYPVPSTLDGFTVGVTVNPLPLSPGSDPGLQKLSVQVQDPLSGRPLLVDPLVFYKASASSQGAVPLGQADADRAAQACMPMLEKPA